MPGASVALCYVHLSYSVDSGRRIKGKPGAIRGRKATGPTRPAGPPNSKGLPRCTHSFDHEGQRYEAPEVFPGHTVYPSRTENPLPDRERQSPWQVPASGCVTTPEPGIPVTSSVMLAELAGFPAWRCPFVDTQAR